MNFKAEYITSIGGRSQNQDRAGILELSNAIIAVVCDGMGGAKAGDVAAEMTVNKLLKGLENIELKTDNISKAISQVNEEIFDKANSSSAYSRMGTTLALAIATSKKLLLSTVGDSRIYKYTSTHLQLLTRDDSIVMDMVDNQLITMEEARLHVRSNVLTQSLGGNRNVIPEVTILPALTKDEGLLICSDGFWSAWSHAELTSLVCGLGNDIDDSLRTLMTKTEEKLNGKDNYDNITIALMQTL